MSKCDLQIELDEPDRTFRPGDTIKGAVRVSVDANCECDGLTLECQWETHGRGNTNSGDPTVQTLHKGPWYAGEAHRYPFELEAPAGPFTYHGHYLNVDWYLNARADIPWAIDPKANTEFLLEPPAEPTPPSRAAPGAGGANAQMGMKIGLIMGCIFGTVGLVIGGIGLALGMGGDWDKWVLVPFGAVFGLAGVLILYLAIRNSLAERKLGPVMFQVQPRQCGPGTTLTVDLECSPQASGEIQGITAQLRGYERCVRGSGTNKTTHTHELHSEQIELSGARSFAQGDELSLRGELTLPDDAPFSFESGSNDLIWDVSATIDIAGWPDWSSSQAVKVRP